MKYINVILIILIGFPLMAQNLEFRQSKEEKRTPLIHIPLIGLAQQAVESGDIWFYPENLSWIDTRNGTVSQGACVPGSVKYVEITDRKLNIGLKRVTRIVGNMEVLEDRIVSEYKVVIHFNDGGFLDLGGLDGVKMISNQDNVVPIPGTVPGSRWTFKSAVDDPNHIFGTGVYSVDGGLKIDYD